MLSTYFGQTTKLMNGLLGGGVTAAKAAVSKVAVSPTLPVLAKLPTNLPSPAKATNMLSTATEGFKKFFAKTMAPSPTLKQPTNDVVLVLGVAALAAVLLYANSKESAYTSDFPLDTDDGEVVFTDGEREEIAKIAKNKFNARLNPVLDNVMQKQLEDDLTAVRRQYPSRETMTNYGLDAYSLEERAAGEENDTRRAELTTEILASRGNEARRERAMDSLRSNTRLVRETAISSLSQAREEVLSRTGAYAFSLDTSTFDLNDEDANF